MAQRTTVAERQFALMLALLTSEQGLTKQQILSVVHGYGTERDDERGRLAAGRMFERDKRELRDAGFELESFEDPGAPGDNRLVRYRVRSPGPFAGAGVRLQAEELALIRLAAGVWRDGSLSEQARRAGMKLSALEDERSARLLGVDLRVRIGDPAFEPLRAAIEAGRTVEFDYVVPGRPEPGRRVVEPLALLQHDGRWLLAAHDLQRGQERLFLLSRILGGVAKGGPVDPGRRAAGERRDEVARARARLLEHEAGLRAVLVTEGGSDADTRLRHRVRSLDGRGLECRRGVVLHYSDAALLADEIAAFGPEVRVRAPRSLRAAVRERLERLLAEHEERAAPREDSEER
ncbi:MAG: WYL domain-containing protein [Pseudoclavibacter sp.]|nr:WYL domain-containing protein [Pseudoclavibacter sp.]